MRKEDLAKYLKKANYLKKMTLYARRTTDSNVKIYIQHNHEQKSLDLPSIKISSQSIKAEEMLLIKKAIAMRDELESRAGGIVISDKKKTSECMEEWIKSYSILASQRNARQASKHFLNANGDIPARDLSRANIIQMMDMMKQTSVSQNYVRDMASRIRAFCNWAEQRGYTQRIDTRKLLPPIRFGEVKRLTEEEIARLASTPAEECPDVKDLFLLGIYTAQRPCEMRQYTFALWRDKEIRARQGKTGKFIVIPLSEGALQIIERLKDRRQAEGRPAGPDDKIFNLPCKRDVKKTFVKWLADAGIPEGKVTMRNSRSTSISLLINKGVPESVTQELANHADVRTTARYYRQIDDSRKKEALAKIPVFG